MARASIHVIYMGGTIGGRVLKPSAREGHPEIDKDLSPKRFFKKLQFAGFTVPPETDLIYREDALVYDLSENLLPSDWASIAKVVLKAREEGATGAVIAHGTDTMTWTASALAFLLRGLDIPVVITGSRFPLEDRRSDAVRNLSDAVLVACKNSLRGVFICFAGGRSVDSLVHLGVRARKTQRLAYGYTSVHVEPIGRVGVPWVLEWRRRLKITNPTLLSQCRALSEAVNVDKDFRICSGVALFKIYPGFDPGWISQSVDGGARGIVLEAYGEGTGPACERTDHAHHKKMSLVPAVRNAVAQRVPVFFTSQHDGYVAMREYGTSSLLRDTGAGPLGDMLSEVAVVKLMCLIEKCENYDTLVEMMVTNLCGEVTEP